MNLLTIQMKMGFKERQGMRSIGTCREERLSNGPSLTALRRNLRSTNQE